MGTTPSTTVAPANTTVAPANTTVAPAKAASAKRAQKIQEATPCDHVVISDNDTNTKEAEAFQLTGWTGQNERFNGDYLPAGSETYNDRPIFIHKTVVGPRAGEDFWMFWTNGAWCIGERPQLDKSESTEDNAKSGDDQEQACSFTSWNTEMSDDDTDCDCFVEANATHPTSICAKAQWFECKMTDGNFHLEPVEGVAVLARTVRARRWCARAGIVPYRRSLYVCMYTGTQTRRPHEL